MLWLRSWPLEEPAGRPRVIDDLPRLLIVRHDLATDPTLYRIQRGFCLLEWDVAVSLEERRLFELLVAGDPEVVHVAPYRLYPCSTGLREPVWAHRAGRRGERWISEEEPTCDHFGFGMVYLPWRLVDRFLAAGPPPSQISWFNDSNFSLWHAASIRHPVPVHWQVRPVHLRYDYPASSLGSTGTT